MYVLTETTLKIKVNTAYSGNAHANDALYTARAKFLKRIKRTHFTITQTCSYVGLHACCMHAYNHNPRLNQQTHEVITYHVKRGTKTLFLPKKEVEGFSLLINKDKSNPPSTSLFHISCFITLRKHAD
jgi:hypothetical protein